MVCAACTSSPPSEEPPPDPPVRSGTPYDTPSLPPTVTPFFDKCCYRHVEGEWFDGWAVQTSLSPYYGAGFATSRILNRPAASTPELDVALEAGTYFVWARAYRDDRDRSFAVEVGDVRLDPSHGPTDQTGGFSWIRTGTVTVDDGLYTLRIHDTGDWAEAVDAVVLTTGLIDPIEEERRFRLLPRNEAAAMVIDELVVRAERYRDAVPQPTTQDEILARADDVRSGLAAALGLDPLPEQTPLLAQVQGTVSFDGYRVEVVEFESRPGMPVTANVFVPDGTGPFPLVVSPVGHGLEKRAGVAAARNHGLARLGYITIVYDPFGQGERAVSGMSHDEHWRLGLSGHSNMTIMVWDSMRALDYMLTRADVDPTRVAVTGYSGGGLNTLYFAGIDERLDVAAPAAYVTTYDAFIGTQFSHDACNYVPGVGGFTSMGEIVATFAPKPYLILSGTDDESFPTAGAELTTAFAAERYEVLGSSDDVQLASFEVGHTYDRPMRERMYGFVSRPFMGTDGSPIDEGDIELPYNEPALVFHDSGQIPSGTTTVRSLARAWALDAIANMPEPDRDAVRAHLEAPEGADFDVERLGSILVGQGFEVERLLFDAGDGVRLPALLHIAEPGAPVVVIVDGAGLASAATLDEAARLGVSALYFAPRGRGELAAPEAWLMASNYLLGDPLALQRAFDLVRVRRALRAMEEVGDAPVGLVAVGAEASTEALFAQSLYGEYDAASIGQTPSTWFDAFSRQPTWSSYVFGILEVADVPQLAYLAGEKPLRVELTTTSWRTHYGAFFERLNERVSVQPHVALPEALAWVVARM